MPTPEVPLDLAQLLRYSGQLKMQAAHLLDQMQRLDSIIAVAMAGRLSGATPNEKEREETKALAEALARASGAKRWQDEGEAIPSFIRAS